MLDPERLLWVPGQRSYFDIVTPKPVFVAGQWVTWPQEHWTDLVLRRDRLNGYIRLPIDHARLLDVDANGPVGIVSMMSPDMAEVEVQIYGVADGLFLDRPWVDSPDTLVRGVEAAPKGTWTC